LPFDPAPAPVPAGYKLVPEIALKWLMGEGPDHNGNWFSDVIPGPGKFWWRSWFRAMLDAAPAEKGER
jgi:hypothetical protein